MCAWRNSPHEWNDLLLFSLSSFFLCKKKDEFRSTDTTNEDNQLVALPDIVKKKRAIMDADTVNETMIEGQDDLLAELEAELQQNLPGVVAEEQNNDNMGTITDADAVNDEALGKEKEGEHLSEAGVETEAKFPKVVDEEKEMRVTDADVSNAAVEDKDDRHAEGGVESEQKMPEFVEGSIHGAGESGTQEKSGDQGIIPDDKTESASQGDVLGEDRLEAPGKTSETVPEHGDSSMSGVTSGVTERESDRLQESRIVGGDVLFNGSPPAYNGWDSLRWMSYSGARKLFKFIPVYRFREKKQKTLFWSKFEKEYVPRVLAIYDEPSVFLVLRRPSGLDELIQVLGSGNAGDERNYWIVESVVDPSTCKLQLSNLTTITSIVAVDETDQRAKSLFEIITPAETIRFSAVKIREDAKKTENSFVDSGAFFETTTVENSITQVICSAHKDDRDVSDDLILKHQGMIFAITTKIGTEWKLKILLLLYSK